MSTKQNLDRALARFRAVLGDDKVITEHAEVLEYRDPFQPTSWHDYEPSYVVQPTTRDEVQAIVRIANEHHVPLWPIGQGRNNAYGGAAPRVGGSVTVSMRNMNRVLEINEELGYAVVEPGVRWFDLYDALQAGGHKLWLSIADIGWGSVVGNALDNGVTYLPYGQDHMAPCGLEVVLANGEVLRTGMGAMEGNPSWHLYRRGFGPTLDPLFMQSNYGIVTRMGVWLLPQPQSYMPVWLRVWEDDDLAPMIDTLRELKLDRTIEGVPQINNPLVFAATVSDRQRWYDGEGAIPEPVVDRIAEELGTGRWQMRFALYGDEAVVDHNFAKIRSAFGKIARADVSGTKVDPDRVAELESPAELVAAGVPNMEINRLIAWRGKEGGHLDFSPVVPLTGRHAIEVRDLMRRLVQDDAGLDCFAGSFALNARSLVWVTALMLDTSDEAECRHVYDTAKTLVREAAKRGFGEYRAHIDLMDVVSDQYGFGDHSYRRFAESIKDAVDPNGILSPGRYGIWPREARAAREAASATGSGEAG